MDSREVFKKYRAKLEREGIITSIVCSLAIGFVVVFALAFTFWMKEIKGLWICAVAGIAVTLYAYSASAEEKYVTYTATISGNTLTVSIDGTNYTMTLLEEKAQA